MLSKSLFASLLCVVSVAAQAEVRGTLKCKLDANVTAVHTLISTENGPSTAQTSFLPADILVMEATSVTGWYQHTKMNTDGTEDKANYLVELDTQHFSDTFESFGSPYFRVEMNGKILIEVENDIVKSIRSLSATYDPATNLLVSEVHDVTDCIFSGISPIARNFGGILPAPVPVP